MHLAVEVSNSFIFSWCFFPFYPEAVNQLQQIQAWMINLGPMSLSYHKIGGLLSELMSSYMTICITYSLYIWKIEENVKQGHSTHQLQGFISHSDLSHLVSLAPLTKPTSSENSCYLLISPSFLPSGVTLMTKCREWPGSIDLTSFSLAQTSGPWILGWIWSLKDSWSTAYVFRR